MPAYLPIKDQPVPPHDIDVFHTVAQVKVNQDINFSFEDTDADLLLDKELERMNFTEIPAGTQLASVFNTTSLPVTAKDETGKIVTDDFFSIIDNTLQINKTTMPSMLTLDERVIKQDCLCYLMERLKL